MGEPSQRPRGPRNVVKVRYVNPKEAEAAGRKFIKVGDDYVYSFDSTSPRKPESRTKRRSIELDDGAESSTSAKKAPEASSDATLSPLPLDFSRTSEGTPLIDPCKQPKGLSATEIDADFTASMPEDLLSVAPESLSTPVDDVSEKIDASSTVFDVTSDGESVRFIVKSVTLDGDAKSFTDMLPSGEVRKVLAWWKKTGEKTKYLVSMSDLTYKNVIVPREFFDMRRSHKVRLLEFYESLMLNK